VELIDCNLHTSCEKDIRPSTISHSQLTIRIKIIYSYLAGDREEREEECALMQEPSLARAPRHFVKVKCGICIDKVTYFYSSLCTCWL
jgi:hypothetical protein